MAFGGSTVFVHMLVIPESLQEQRWGKKIWILKQFWRSLTLAFDCDQPNGNEEWSRPQTPAPVDQNYILIRFFVPVAWGWQGIKCRFTCLDAHESPGQKGKSVGFFFESEAAARHDPITAPLLVQHPQKQTIMA